MANAAVALTQWIAERGDKQNTRFRTSRHFLLGFAVELYLKAALAQAGDTDTQRFRHNLLSAFQAADQRGLLEFSEREWLGALVATLAADHRDLSFRYPEPGRVLTLIPDYERAFTVLQAFDAYIRPDVDLAVAECISRASA